MERIVHNPEVHEEVHYLEAPLQTLLDQGHIVFGQDDDHYTALTEAAIFVHSQDNQKVVELAQHPLIAAIAAHIETESSKEGFNLALYGWQRTLTLLRAAMLTKNDHVKQLVSAIEAKYVQ